MPPSLPYGMRKGRTSPEHIYPDTKGCYAGINTSRVPHFVFNKGLLSALYTSQFNILTKNMYNLAYNKKPKTQTQPTGPLSMKN